MNHGTTTPADPDVANQSSQRAWMHDSAYLSDLRRQMMRFATLQLSDAHLAEDAVQEALIGAMKNTQKFAGRAAFKTWVFAILKNKIADTLRQRHRMVDAGQFLSPDGEEDDSGDLFDRKGFWQLDERPQAWAHPETAIKNDEFWRVFETCLQRLPGHQARVFMMREFVDLDSKEICTSLDISMSNLNVMLHRARLHLRKCLENRWFLKGESC